MIDKQTEGRAKRAARARIRAYYRELAGSILSEEDALGASTHAERVLVEYTGWSIGKCRDIALDMAFDIKPEYDKGVAA